jgi:hypothetical protein
MLKRAVLLMIFSILVLSCKPLAAKLLLGVDTTPEWKSNQEVIEDFSEYDIPVKNRFVLDTAVYAAAVEAKVYEDIEVMQNDEIVIDSAMVYKLESSLNDNLQPVQVRYFTKEGKPVFKLVNCYLDGILKIDWNYEGAFDSYPPATDDEMLNFANHDLDFFLPMLRTINGDRVQMKDLPVSDHYAIIFWNDYFKKPSRKLIKQIQEIEEDRSDTFVLFVNNHNAEFYEMITEESKAALYRSWNK